MPGVEDDDLFICEGNGVAYQRDMTITAKYDADYFQRYVNYDDTDIAQRIHSGRIGLVNDHLGWQTTVLDVGVGRGEFVRCRPHTLGYDINPEAEKWLRERGVWSETLDNFKGYTFWDVLEHVPEPVTYFKHVSKGAYLFTCLPVFDDLRKIRKSKHYRPGEHLYYFTKLGFMRWMGLHGFDCKVSSGFETLAGRESIESFVFVRRRI